MKYHLMIRARPDLDEKIPEKHKRFMNALAKIKGGWGLAGKERPPVKPPNEFFASVSLRGKLGPGISGNVHYQNRKSIAYYKEQFGETWVDDGKYDDYFTLNFDPRKVDYRALTATAFADYVTAFGAYIGDVVNEELSLVDWEEKKPEVFKRSGVYRICPICYFDRELCRRAFGLAPEQVARKVAAVVEKASIVANGALIVASSNVLGLREIDDINQKLRPLLTGKPAAPTKGLKRLLAKGDRKAAPAGKREQPAAKKKVPAGGAPGATFAKAIIEAMLFLETAGDEEIHPDVAVQGLEQIAYRLQRTSEEERAMLRQALQELTAGEKRAEVLEFYSDFMANLGLADE